jgi:hypothetical protein
VNSEAEVYKAIFDRLEQAYIAPIVSQNAQAEDIYPQLRLWLLPSEPDVIGHNVYSEMSMFQIDVVFSTSEGPVGMLPPLRMVDEVKRLYSPSLQIREGDTIVHIMKPGKRGPGKDGTSEFMIPITFEYKIIGGF